MTVTGFLETRRLLLRPWRAADREPYAAINADPRVMEFFPKTLTREESDRHVDSIIENFRTLGFGHWACEVKETGQFIGFVGLNTPRFDAHFTPTVEIGWRLAFEAWGNGFAPEGARAVLDAAFSRFGLEEVVSFTAALNTRSIRVMQKIGMTHNPADDFMHPALPIADPLCRHVLFRAARKAWREPR